MMVEGGLGFTAAAAAAWLRHLAPPFIAACLLQGCGARAILEADADEAGFAGQASAGGSAGGPSVGRGGRGGSSPRPTRPRDPIDYIPEVLPPCVPGLPVSSARECAFIHESFCYEEQEMACACACPNGGMCIIRGFLSPDEPFPVSCRRLQ